MKPDGVSSISRISHKSNKLISGHSINNKVSLNYRECRCQGNNVNCMYCYGTGLLKPSVPSGKNTNKKRKGVIATSDAAMLPLFSASSTTKPTNVENKSKKASVESKPKKSKPLLLKSKTVMVKCSVCRVLVSEHNYERHLKKAHSSPVKRKTDDDCKNTKHASKTKKIRNGFVRCVHCNLLILKARLADHLERIHRPNRVESIKAQSSQPAPQAGRAKGIINEKLVSPTKNIDGSYGYHILRDHGQFGSHPSFDSCDDD